jgi:hypothetical protein
MKSSRGWITHTGIRHKFDAGNVSKDVIHHVARPPFRWSPGTTILNSAGHTRLGRKLMGWMPGTLAVGMLPYIGTTSKGLDWTQPVRSLSVTQQQQLLEDLTHFLLGGCWSLSTGPSF